MFKIKFPKAQILSLLFAYHICFAEQFINYTNQNHILDIAIHNNEVWLATDCGIAKMDVNGNPLSWYTTADGLVHNHVQTIAIDRNGNMWFGTVGGVCKFDGTNWITYTESDGLVDRHVNTVAIDYENNKWFGTVEGVSKFNDTNWTTYKHKTTLEESF